LRETARGGFMEGSMSELSEMTQERCTLRLVLLGAAWLAVPGSSLLLLPYLAWRLTRRAKRRRDCISATRGE